MIQKTTFLFSLLLLSFSAFTQRNCGSMEYLQEQLLLNPEHKQAMEAIELQTQRFVNTPQNARAASVTIPVVVHVIYNNSAENVSDAQIQSQIDVLNEDFRRLNADADGTWPQAADSDIEFCLASVDPNGNATNGITRTSTSTSAFGTNDQMKFNSSGGKDAWSRDDYMNIWVCDISGGILGYAQFPGSGSAATDGIVIDYAYFGRGGSAQAPFDLGRTATHEVGHWLNLRHIWGDGGCGVDDFVSDTPESDASNGGCATGHVSCGSTDMVQNYMDYSDDACMNLFTNGQKTRMQALFGSGGARASLLNSPGCGAGNPATCSDGVQNQGETGVDCGGPCAPCNTGCNENSVTVSITLDNYPEETSWTITNASGATIASGGTYGSSPDGSTVSEDLCLPDGCYDFTINDSYGDGICCSYGSGSYTVSGGGSTYASGGSFGSSETTNFCLGSGPVATCSDGIQNQGETGIDCGGPCTACATCNDGIQNQGETDVDCGGPCTACPTCDDGIQNQGETGIDCGGPCSPCGGSGSTLLLGSYFETGLDGWIDGGGDCYRYNGSRSYEGNRSMRLRDNSSTASSMTTGYYNINAYGSIEIEFYFYANSMENGEDFWVRFDNGSGWQTVAAYARGTNFNNNTFYTATVVINSGDYTFNSASRFRFQCDASSNADQVYIDQVTITGISAGVRVALGNTIKVVGGSVERSGYKDLIDEDFQVYPNPTADVLNVVAEEAIKFVNIYGVNGALIETIDAGNREGLRITTDKYKAGLYIVEIETEEERMQQKFIKQ